MGGIWGLGKCPYRQIVFLRLPHPSFDQPCPTYWMGTEMLRDMVIVVIVPWICRSSLGDPRFKKRESEKLIKSRCGSMLMCGSRAAVSPAQPLAPGPSAHLLAVVNSCCLFVLSWEEMGSVSTAAFSSYLLIAEKWCVLASTPSSRQLFLFLLSCSLFLVGFVFPLGFLVLIFTSAHFHKWFASLFSVSCRS